MDTERYSEGSDQRIQCWARIASLLNLSEQLQPLQANLGVEQKCDL